MTMTEILVTGATGTIGSTLVPLLTTRGATVAALVRDRSRAESILGNGVRLTVGDFADPAARRAAVEGIDSLFLACGNVPEQVRFECAMIDEAARAGVGLIVKLSARGAAVRAPVAYWDWHGRIECHLKAAGIPVVLLQPSFLMTNLLGAADDVRQRGMLFAPAALARISMIDPADVAAAAAVALTTPGHDGNTYVLTGPEPITYAQVAANLSAATDQSVGYANIPPEAARSALVAAGLPPFAADQVVAVFAALRKGQQAQTTDAVRAVTGRTPRSFAEFACDHASAFRADSVSLGV